MNIPVFTSEQEEAEWWFENRSSVGEAIAFARRKGLAGEGSRSRYQRKLMEAQKTHASAENQDALRR